MAGILATIAKALGKSEDEVMEVLSKQGRIVTSGADDMDMGDISSPAFKKGRPAKSPIVDPNELDLGKASKKKLEIGDVESAEVPVNQLDLGDAPDINPSIDDLRLPVKAPIVERGLQGGGQVPALRSPTTPSVVEPEVIGKGTSRASKESSEAIEAELVKKGMNPKLAKIAVASGLVGGGAMALKGSGGGAGQPPVPPEAPAPAVEPVLPDNYMDLANAEAAGMGNGQPKQELSATDQARAGMDKFMANIPQDESAAEPQKQEEVSDAVNFRQMMQEALQAKHQDSTNASMLRASENIAAGLSRTKADYGGSEIHQKRAGERLGDAEKVIGSITKQADFDKAQSELGDDKAMRDPKSAISKMTTELAIKLNILKPGQTASAMQLKNAGLNLGTLLSTREAAEGRKETANLAREARSEEAKLKRDGRAEEEDKKREDKRKLITEEVEDRRRNIMDNITIIKQAVQDKGTTELLGSHNENIQRMIDAIAVDMAKLSDPKSVARPAEVEMFKRGLFGSGTEGLKLTNKTALDILDKFTEEVDRRAANAYKVRGVAPDNVPTPTPGSSEDSVKPMLDGEKERGKQLVKKQYSASRDQTRLIFSDGSEEVVDGKQ